MALLMSEPLAASPAAAPSPEESLPDSVAMTLGEVDVTAIKSGAGLTEQPVSATSVGITEIDRLNIVTVKGASPLVPNFYIPDYGSRMTSSVYVRGLGARIDQPVVGLNVDNVCILNKDNYDFDLPDITRIEVIRGPQGTLYGRNTMGGVVNVHTLSPMDWQGVRAAVTFGIPFTTRLQAGAYFKPVETLGMGVTAYFTHTDGDWHNDYNHSRIGTETAGSLRWKTVWHPSTRFTLENTAALQLNEQNGYPYAYEGTGRIAYNDTCFYHRVSFSDGLTVNWHISPSVTLSSISSVQYLADNMTLDNDFLPEDYFVLTQRRREWAVTQDFILKGSAAKGRYSWLAGLFGFYRSPVTDAPVTFGDYGISRLIEAHPNSYNPLYPIRWDERSFPLDSHFFAPLRGLAIYHKSTLELDRFTLAAGLRLDLEHPSLIYRSSCSTSYTVINLTDPAHPTVYARRPVELDERGHLSMDIAQLLPCFEAQWKLPATMGNVYLNIAKGYKSGGYNAQMFSDVLQQRLMGILGISQSYDADDILSYRPEWSWNYEVGAHLRFPAAGLRVDLAAFYIDCHDQQLTVFPDGNTTGRMMTNAGRTRSIGAELSVAWRFAPRWHVDASYGFTDARFREYDNGIRSFRGNRLPYAPANTLWANLRYLLPLRSEFLHSVEFNLNTRGVGDIWWDDANTRRQPFYLMPGASATARTANSDIELWVTNFTGARHDVFSFTSIGHDFVQRGPGCRAGLSLRLSLPR
ncbi:MAG: TonB-dependent receptor [Candidatus Amulumruptor caecigallinarius]|nr:TonB-dependent receptor [Candidatus Amulumruptor caecigallinarius]MCM1396410.1 TonB-dependent receptor [Candidatus Amulumruptor caecigallinarius]MCM1453533.1 TonB-dependent receptor [bacterium]